MSILDSLLGPIFKKGVGHDFLFGKKGGWEGFENFTPEQRAILDKILGGLGGINEQGMNYLSQILSDDPELMKQFEAPYLRQFNEQIVPGIAERFTQAGARNSSGFNQAIAQQAGSLSERLAAMRAGLKQNALEGAFGYNKFGLAPRRTNFWDQGNQGFLGSMGQGLGYGLGMGARGLGGFLF